MPRPRKNLLYLTNSKRGVGGSAVGWGTSLQARRSRVRFSTGSYNPFGDSVALVSTQRLTEMSTWNIFWGRGGGKVGRCVGLTTLPLSCADCLEIWEPEPPGTLRTVQTCHGIVWNLARLV